jgi:hypothetical protein
MKLYTIA